MKEFSVILLLYNSTKESVRRTLASILCQEKVDWELILSDDGSSNNCLQEAEEYLLEKHYSNYKVKRHPQNVGTVQNIADAMELVEGKYVKCIGAGDLFFERFTLKTVYDYMEKDDDASMCFGKMQAYSEKDSRLKLSPISCPPDILAFKKKNIKRIQQNIIKNNGFISGASMFYRSDKFKLYLESLLGVVTYCEDLLQIILLLNNERIIYLDDGLIYYEMGTGISTNTNIGNSIRMKHDFEEFWNMIIKKYPENSLLKSGRNLYHRECIPEKRKRQLQVIIFNPGYVFMLLRTFFQKKIYEVNDNGMLQEIVGEENN